MDTVIGGVMVHSVMCYCGLLSCYCVTDDDLLSCMCIRVMYCPRCVLQLYCPVCVLLTGVLSCVRLVYCPLCVTDSSALSECMYALLTVVHCPVCVTDSSVLSFVLLIAVCCPLCY